MILLKEGKYVLVDDETLKIKDTNSESLKSEYNGILKNGFPVLVPGVPDKDTLSDGIRQIEASKRTLGAFKMYLRQMDFVIMPE